MFMPYIYYFFPSLDNLCTTNFSRGYSSYYLGMNFLPSVGKLPVSFLVHISVFLALRISPPPVDDPTPTDLDKQYFSPESTGPTTTTTYNYLER